MSIAQPEAIEEHRTLIGDIIMVGIAQKEKLGRLANIDPAVPKQNSGSEVQAVSKHRDFVRASIRIGILQDLDSIAWFDSVRGPQRILIKLNHPQSPTSVPGHCDRVYGIRFGREQPRLETRWQCK